MSTHAQLSPSKRHRWALCPGSIREEAKCPDERTSPAAIDGTHSHTLLEYCIDRGLSDPMDQVGEVFADDDGSFVVDADRAARVKIAVDYIMERSMNGLFKVISEQRVDPQHLLGRDDFHSRSVRSATATAWSLVCEILMMMRFPPAFSRAVPLRRTVGSPS